VFLAWCRGAPEGGTSPYTTRFPTPPELYHHNWQCQ